MEKMDLKNLSKSFDKVLFENLNLKLENGKLYLIKAISGCGKTTLLNIMAGLDCEYEGECLYEGKDIKDFSDKEKKQYRKKVGYITQQSLLVGDMNVYDNLLFISDDRDYVEELAEKFGVKELLSKMPVQLSGGERQRISVIRALLKKPDILIADEPTASLGSKHSKMLAEFFSVVKRTGVITIVATHENVFDDIADMTLKMEPDGKYRILENEVGDVKDKPENGEEEKTAVKLRKSENDTTEEFKNNGKTNESIAAKGSKNLRFSFAKLKKSKNLVMLIFLTLIQLVLLMAIGMLMNYRREFIKDISEEYKSYIMEVEKYQYEELVDRYGNDSIEKLDFYYYNEKGFEVYSLLDKEESGFSIDGALECGRFPENENEVLVDANYAGYETGSENHDRIIGKEVEIAGKKYTISGVIIGNDDLRNEKIYQAAYGEICAYKNYNEEPRVFAMKSVVEEIGELYEDNSFNIRFRDFYEHGELLDNIVSTEKIRESLFNIPCSDKMRGGLYQIEIVNKIVIILVIAIALTMIIFVQNQTNMAMYFRRAEFGYLQLFGVETSRIKKLVILENVIKAVVSIVIADIVYLILMMIVKSVTGMKLMCDMWIIALLAVITLVYLIMSAALPVRRLLREDVVRLTRG